jgi:hypothetical protein
MDYSRKNGKPGFTRRNKDGSTTFISLEDLEREGKKEQFLKDLERNTGRTFQQWEDSWLRRRGEAQLKRDAERLKAQSQAQQPQMPDLRGGNNEVDGYGKPKVDYTRIKVEPYKEPETTPPTTPPTSTPKNLTPQQRAYGPGSTLSKAQQDANLEYDKKRYELDDKGDPIIGKLRTDPKEARAARNFGLKKNIENFPNQRVFVRPDEEPKKPTADTKTSPGAGSYAAYQNNVLKNLGSDYGRLPQNTVKPVVKRTMKKEAYDVVLDYLLSEGHVDTVEEAHYVMLQMTSEHVQDIVEGKYSNSVRATYGGVTDTFPVEVYQKKGKGKVEMKDTGKGKV